MQQLLIVESPNKIKKISSILGDNWLIKASVGHIRDLPKKSLGVDRFDRYLPKYEVSEDKKVVVAGLYKAVKQVGANNVFLATDPDREGEAIAYHLCKALGLPVNTTKRVTFNEITENAVKTAVNNPRKIDNNLVNAQEARRVIDRLAGYEVSSMLNQKVLTNGSYLTAGRVQSVAVKLAVEREEAIERFQTKVKYKLKARFLSDSANTLDANLVGELESKEAVEKHFINLKLAKFHINSIINDTEKEAPPPPFTTSSLQQVAIKKYKWSASKVMEVAQKLFEAGHITYMRTDSPNLSDLAIDDVKKYLAENNRLKDFQKRVYKAKGNAQEAHEAIRPTHFDAIHVSRNTDEQNLYTLIFKRTICSQMVDAVFATQAINVVDSVNEKNYEAKARKLIESGFKVFYSESDDDNGQDIESFGDSFKVSQSLHMANMICKGIFVSPPKRYNEATLVKALEEHGIGRPSTYASILKNIIELRKYLVDGSIAAVEKEIDVFRIDSDFKITFSKEQYKLGGEKNVLIPQPNGFAITKFLNEKFGQMVDYKFTSDIEESLDLICEGKNSYYDVVKNFDAVHSKSLESCSNMPDLQVKKQFIELGNYDGKPVKLGKSEKGHYLLYSDKFYSVQSSDISLNVAIREIEIQEKARNESIINSVGQYTIKIGKFGYYFTDQKQNNIPIKKGLDIDAIKALNIEQLKDMATSYKTWKAKSIKK